MNLNSVSNHESQLSLKSRISTQSQIITLKTQAEKHIISPLPLERGRGVRLLIILLIILYQLRHHLLNRAYYHIVGNLVDGCLWVAVY